MVKKEKVQQMFNNIAPTYILLNHLLSMGIDKYWRRKAVNVLKNKLDKNIESYNILDIATGTADFSIAACKIKDTRFIGVDISEKMMEFGRKKIADKGLQSRVVLQYGDAENLYFESDQFDVVLCAFGVRNFEHTLVGLQEIKRVLKPNCTFIVLEFSNPKNIIVRYLYNLYFFKILPFVGRLISNDKEAYSYLPASVKDFYSQDAFSTLLKDAGFSNVLYKDLSFGIVTMYVAEK